MLLDCQCLYLYLYGHGCLGDVQSLPQRRCSSSHRRGIRATFGRRRPRFPSAAHRRPAPRHHTGQVAGGLCRGWLRHRRSLRSPLLDGGHRPGGGRGPHATRRCRTARSLPPSPRVPENTGTRGSRPLGQRPVVRAHHHPSPLPRPGTPTHARAEAIASISCGSAVSSRRTVIWIGVVESRFSALPSLRPNPNTVIGFIG